MRKNRFNLILNKQAMTLNKNMIGKNIRNCWFRRSDSATSH